MMFFQLGQTWGDDDDDDDDGGGGDDGGDDDDGGGGDDDDNWCLWSCCVSRVCLWWFGSHKS